MIHKCSGITCGRVLSGELYVHFCVLYIQLHTTTITEVNLTAFIYRLFHEDFSSILGINFILRNLFRGLKKIFIKQPVSKRRLIYSCNLCGM